MEVRNLCKSYSGETVLNDFSAVFPQGEVTCIMGKSGCGKTTFLRILLGLTEKDSGELLDMPSRPGVVFQENRLVPGMSVMKNIRLVAPLASDEQILSHLGMVGLSEVWDRPVEELSGGMARRLAIVRAVLYDGDCLVMDEPFQGLDAQNLATVMQYVREKTKGKTVVLVTHHEEEAEFFGGNLVRM